MSNIYLNKDPNDQSEYYFISYKRQDQQRLNSIVEKLDKINVWYDYAIEYGEEFASEIFKHIKNSKAVILFLSNQTFKCNEGKTSFVSMEYDYAKTHDKKIIAVFLEKIDPKEVPENMWLWYKEIISIESIVSDNYENDESLISLIYGAIGLPKPIIGKDIHINLSLTQNEAKNGCEKTILIRYDDGHEEDQIIDIPNQIENGQVLLIEGKGNPGVNGGINGNLYIKIIVEKPVIVKKRSYKKYIKNLLTVCLVISVGICGYFANDIFYFNKDSSLSEDTTNEIISSVETNNQGTIAVGSIITLGQYQGEKLKWRVLDYEVKNDSILIITENIIDYWYYFAEASYVYNRGWEYSDIRENLNDGQFIDEIFSGTGVTPLETEINNGSSSSTMDQIFLLSVEEVKTYFDSNDDRQSSKINNSNTSAWWLRSHASFTNNAAIVDSDGSVHSNADGIDTDKKGVRPACWISISNF